MIGRIALLLLLFGVLCGCAVNPLRPPREEWPEIGNEFAKSLRWGGRDLGATFFSGESRAAFLSVFGDGGALQIIDVRHDPTGSPTNREARGILSLEYYRSPSVSVKKITIPLVWSCEEAGPLLPCRWQITTSFTPLP